MRDNHVRRSKPVAEEKYFTSSINESKNEKAQVKLRCDHKGRGSRRQKEVRDQECHRGSAWCNLQMCCFHMENFTGGQVLTWEKSS